MLASAATREARRPCLGGGGDGGGGDGGGGGLGGGGEGGGGLHITMRRSTWNNRVIYYEGQAKFGRILASRIVGHSTNRIATTEVSVRNVQIHIQKPVVMNLIALNSTGDLHLINEPEIIPNIRT